MYLSYRQTLCASIIVENIILVPEVELYRGGTKRCTFGATACTILMSKNENASPVGGFEKTELVHFIENKSICTFDMSHIGRLNQDYT